MSQKNKAVTFSVSSCLSGLLLVRTSWKLDKTLCRRVKSLFVEMKDESQTNYGDIYNRIICCLGISGKQSEGGRREKKEKQMRLMLGTELCCALRSRQAYSVYCLQAGETPLSNHAGEEVHGRENRKRENALKCKQAHSHLLSHSLLFPHAFICKQISDGKKYSSLQKSTKWPWKIKCTKKTYREYHSKSVKRKPTAVWSLSALQCFMWWMLTGL